MTTYSDSHPSGGQPEEGLRPQALYEAFAASLYRYSWSLLGEGGEGPEPDRAGAAVYEAFLAAVELSGELADPSEQRAWMFALTRAACQRRSFTQVSPYTRLSTVPAERPVVEMMSRLPASNRELLELQLRHGLSITQTAKVVGLDADICVELCRSAVRRAMDGLADRSVLPAWTVLAEEGGLATAKPVAEVMALLRPPGPPPELRERVIEGCADPALAERRRRAGAAVLPLGIDGFPLHRTRRPVRDHGPAAGSADQDETAPPAPETAEAAGSGSTAALPPDRVTTADHTVTESGHVAQLASEGPAEEPPRRRWPLAAVSGVATVVLALTLWWAATFLGEAPGTRINAGPSDTGPRHAASEQVSSSSLSDGRPGADPGAESSVTAVQPLPSPAESAPEAGEADRSAARAPQEGEAADTGGSTAPAPEPEAEGPPPPTASAEGEAAPPKDTPDDDTGDGLLKGLFGLLFPER